MSVTVGSTGHPFTVRVFLQSLVVICGNNRELAMLYLQKMQHILFSDTDYVHNLTLFLSWPCTYTIFKDSLRRRNPLKVTSARRLGVFEGVEMQRVCVTLGHVTLYCFCCGFRTALFLSIFITAN